ncbi:MAG: hypothetical protein H6817_02695 [Phycisphaerales bacterium]|nr:hypothetical protein [Phycisphaerales bacterium]
MNDESSNRTLDHADVTVADDLARYRDQHDDDLLSLSQASPVLVVFLRHYG